MKNLYKALADFRKDCPDLYKKTKGYNYEYLDLPDIIKQITPILDKHSISFSQPLATNPDTQRLAIKTTILHYETGEMETEWADIPEGKLNTMNIYQSLGSGITYFRRYTLCAALGIVGSEDNDASDKPKQQNKAPQPKKINWTEKAFKDAVNKLIIGEIQDIDELKTKVEVPSTIEQRILQSLE
mgnify:CR=1 FL=1|tara:strand:+ start:556 stop:1110 length:555 start_codon:yes stop_codon:yes gene_type:complete